MAGRRYGKVRSVRMAGLLAVLALLLVGACGGDSTPEPAPSSPPPSSPTPTETPTVSDTVPVYYHVDTANELRLAREFTRIAGAGADPASAAVARMLTGPAADPDYSTPWNPATTVRSIDVADDRITVDLSADARTANVGAAGAELAVQQLVYTVTAALQQTLPVVLLIEGESAGELWGHVVWDGPIGRAPALDVRLLVQINDPAEGASVPPSFTVTGEAAVFEATLPWRILDSSGSVVQEGFAMTDAGQQLAPFDFRIEHGGPPGTYTLEIREDDPSGGEGRPAMTDDKTITIR
jgi:hypothetical protein